MQHSRKLTTIAIDQENKKALSKLGTAGMSYNDVITLLIEGSKQAPREDH
jgi:hypothetical protein